MPGRGAVQQGLPLQAARLVPQDAEERLPRLQTGCSIYVDHNKDIVYRLRPRDNPQAQGHFMCDEGRFGYHYINARQRLRGPAMRRERRGAKGEDARAAWAGKVLHGAVSSERLSADRMRAKAARRAVRRAVLSPFLTCEEGVSAGEVHQGAVASRRGSTWAGCRCVGEDDTYPKDRKGQPVQPVKFTIRAEKCPNRRGVEEVLKHFQGEVLASTRLLEHARHGKSASALPDGRLSAAARAIG